jgi:hypothetical protein
MLMEPMQMQLPVRELNLRFHEGSVSITKDGSVIYFQVKFSRQIICE